MGLDGNGAQDLVEDILVFLALERAGGIDEQAAGGKALEGVAENEGLAPVKISKIGGSETPFDFGVAGEGAGA